MLAFARRLSQLPRARLEQLALPGAIRAEIADLQRTPSHIAHKRQLAHLAKLMRAQDAGTFDAVRAVLAKDNAASVRDAARQHHLEALREDLLGDDGDAALHAFIAAHPGSDRQHLRALIRQARRERDTGAPPRAQRELFRLLREHDANEGVATKG